MTRTTAKTNRPKNNVIPFKEVEVADRAKRFCKKRYNKKITRKEAKAIWKEWCEIYMHQPLLNSEQIAPKPYFGTFEIVKVDRSATPAGQLSLNGFSRTRGGLMKKFEQKNMNRINYVYKFMYTPGSLMQKQTIFKACSRLRKKFTTVLNESPRDYRYVTKCQ